MKDGRQGLVDVPTPPDTTPAASMPQATSRWKRSLRVQILVATLVVGLIPIVLSSLVAMLGFRNLASTAEDGLTSTRQTLASETVTSRLQAEADEVERTLDRVLAERIDDVARWARQPSATDPAYLSNELEQHHDFVGLAFHGDGADVPGWSEAMESGIYVGGPALESTGQRYVIPIAVQVTDPNDDSPDAAPVGVVVGELAIETFHEVTDTYAIDDGQVTVITADRILIAETGSGHDPSRIGVDTLSRDDLATGLNTAVGSGQGSVTESDVVYGYTRVGWAKTTMIYGQGVTAGTAWIVVASEPTTTAFAALSGLEGLGRDLHQVRGQLALYTVLVLFASLVACFVAAHVMARNLVAPVRDLTQRAQLLADEDLTATAARPDDPDHDFASLENHSIGLNAGNELDALAASFDSVHRTAIRMATEQAHLRQITADMFANLGRRNQSLVKRQLRFIEELERSEEDPDRLASLFKLDHLATRMRRNAESLLVIAGHRANSRRSSPVRIELVTQAALGEVENFERVDTTAVEPAAIMGRAVAGLAHVLAELIENALSFSPPEAAVRIVGERGEAHYTLTVIDRGIGLLPEDLKAINERLDLGPESDLTSSKQLGLLVVAKLASRYGFRVRLVESAAGGVAARVEIPNTLVQPPELSSTPPVSDANASIGGRPIGAGVSKTPKLPPASGPSPTSTPRAERHDRPAAAPAGARFPPAEPSGPSPAPSYPPPEPRRSTVRAPRPEPAHRRPPAQPRKSDPAPERWPAPDPMRQRGDDGRTSDGRASDDRASDDRYAGRMSATSTSQVSAVPRRESKRTPSDGAPDRGRRSDDVRPRPKRAVAMAVSGDELVGEATDVRNRWNRFRAGRRSAEDHDRRAGGSGTGSGEE